MKSLAKLLFLGFTTLIFLYPRYGAARIYIPVDQSSEQKFPIAVPDLKGGSLGERIAQIIRNDLALSGYFELIPPDKFQSIARKEGIIPKKIRFPFWSAIGAQALVKGEVHVSHGRIVITARLFDPTVKQMILGKQYTGEKKALRNAAHRFSDEIMQALTGIRGVFNTKIAFTAATGKKRKEIYVMDMDGYNMFAVTKNHSINISPCWSPDGSYLAFTSYMRGNPDLYVIRLGKKSSKIITKGHGTNITPSWSPKGGYIAFASSVSGITNLYLIHPNGRQSHRLTISGSIDLAPSWSPDASEIVFSSERAGGLHLFKKPSHGGPAQRLTFVGYQNDMPDWSPMGDKITFAGRDMGTFDIFIMNPDGSNIQRLTIASGSNEHPSFSPDGRFITFSSTRGGGTSIYIMRADGSNQTRISKGGGILPAWGPRED